MTPPVSSRIQMTNTRVDSRQVPNRFANRRTVARVCAACRPARHQRRNRDPVVQCKRDGADSPGTAAIALDDPCTATGRDPRAAPCRRSTLRRDLVLGVPGGRIIDTSKVLTQVGTGSESRGMTDPTQQPRLVVGVGAAAGGLDAFKQLLAALTGDTGMAFLLVQHLDPNHKSLLAELLAACTEMTVTDADQGVELRPNTVYIIRPDTSLAVQDGRIELSMPTLHRGVRLPVDHLFRSLARDYGARATGIVLSGAGSDGSAGLRDIKGVGGLTIAQCPESSGQTGMPRSAIDTGLVDLVLEISEMPAALERFANLPPGAITEPSCGECEGERDGESGERLKCLDKQKIGQLAALLEAHANFDPRVYKSSTIERRVLRRMALSGHEEIDAYLDHLRESQLEQQTLVRDMLIGVTEFFRDSGAFRALRERVLDPLARKVPSGKTLRVWVPACSTGEEAYSIGMELLDALESVGKPATVQVFATDIDQLEAKSRRLELAWETARGGIYEHRVPFDAFHLSQRPMGAHPRVSPGGAAALPGISHLAGGGDGPSRRPSAPRAELRGLHRGPLRALSGGGAYAPQGRALGLGAHHRAGARARHRRPGAPRARPDARHHRSQADRGGRARERAALPRDDRRFAADRVGARRAGPAGIRQRDLLRVLRRHRRGDEGRTLADAAAPR
jgi:chemotaxis response regulator CheB